MLLFFEMGSHSVALVGLELDNVDQAGFRLTEILLLPKCWDYLFILKVIFKNSLEARELVQWLEQLLENPLEKDLGWVPSTHMVVFV